MLMGCQFRQQRNAELMLSHDVQDRRIMG